MENWVELIEIFRNNIDASAICPICKIGILTVTDIAFDNKNIEKGGERLIQCPHCGVSRIILYRNPPENWFKKK